MALEPVAADIVIEDTRPSLDWPAIIAGAVVAAAISFVLLSFGTGIGLSLTSPYPREGVSVTAFLVILAAWVIWVTITSFVAGGYLAGRMRRTTATSTQHQREVRDGIHGLVVWAVGLLLGAAIAASSITGIARTGTAAATGAAAGLTSVLSEAADPLGYIIDGLLRIEGAAPATPAPNPGEARAEATRILAASATAGQISDADRRSLALLVSRQTGLNEPDATARVDAIATQYREAVATARDAAEKARKFSLLLAFLAAATLAIAAAAAWWGAGKGGEHRDSATDFSDLTRWRRT